MRDSAHRPPRRARTAWTALLALATGCAFGMPSMDDGGRDARVTSDRSFIPPEPDAGGPCTPGTLRPCYFGPPDTEGVGACRSGIQECLPDGTWPATCEGAVVPTLRDTCDDGVDNDCNGRVDDACCAPTCAGRVCGDNGCGGVCGTCPAGQSCSAAGACVAGCTPRCAGRECGADGCGGSCGMCPAGTTCDAAGGVCVPPCTPNCAGRACGSDGCGGTCGACPAGQSCDGASGTCSAAPMCVARAGACAAGGAACCAPYVCGTTSLGRVCCGERDAPCASSNECCGSQWCCNVGGVRRCRNMTTCS